MGLLDGKVALITGGARGQGRAHALTSAREGADVVLVDVATDLDTVPYPLAAKEDLLETARLVQELGRRAVAVVGDVRSQASLDDAVALGVRELGKVDVLIANAGILSSAPVWEMSEQQWQDMLDVNLTGVWRSVKAVLPHMIERRTGSIVLTSSANGDEPDMNIAHYTSAKHGVLGLMRSVALEAAQFGIRCNAIKPGFIASPMTSWQGMLDLYAGHEGGTLEDMRKAGYHFNALPQPMMQPEASARAALYLNSDLAAEITGVALDIDAGHRMLPHYNMAPDIPDASDSRPQQ